LHKASRRAWASKKGTVTARAKMKSGVKSAI